LVAIRRLLAFSQVLADVGPVLKQPLHLPVIRCMAPIVYDLKTVHYVSHRLRGQSPSQLVLVLFGSLAVFPGMTQLLR
jgi:hypothetical protein